MTNKFWEQLEAANDEQDVRRRIAEGLYHPPQLGIAQEWIRRRDEARANQRHADLIDEIKRPHWSITPGFLVGVVAMVAACIAAYPVLFPQAQSPAFATGSSTKTTPPASNTPSSSQPLSKHLPPEQTGKPRK